MVTSLKLLVTLEKSRSSNPRDPMLGGTVSGFGAYDELKDIRMQTAAHISEMVRNGITAPKVPHLGRFTNRRS